jgi:hypothetical protein
LTEHNLFYYLYTSFTNVQPPPLKVAAMYFDKLCLLDPIGANWDTVSADDVARESIRLLEDEGILLTVFLTKYIGLDGQNTKTRLLELAAFRADLIAKR